ncbi:MAG: BrnT family toxin [Oscillospiraceae bacterium]|jgi:uncharacterized DUF497 family protein|nr:BrnT family toxin [Oscillospiraceae bacterium]
MNMIFEWDENKNRINLRKHGVSFEEAESVFYDEFSLLLNDLAHSETEDRFNVLGLSVNANLLMVCHCYREGDTIRIISARKSTKTEAENYWRY